MRGLWINEYDNGQFLENWLTLVATLTTESGRRRGTLQCMGNDVGGNSQRRPRVTFSRGAPGQWHISSWPRSPPTTLHPSNVPRVTTFITHCLPVSSPRYNPLICPRLVCWINKIINKTITRFYCAKECVCILSPRRTRYKRGLYAMAISKECVCISAH